MSMDSPEWLVLTLLRFLVPLLILRWPLFGILASMLADAVFSHLLPLPHGGFYHYQVWDKVLDTYYLSLAAYTSYFWKDRAARAVSLFSFSFRVVGVLLFIVTDYMPMIFLFPNFFENFFVFYLVFKKFRPKEKLFNSSVVFAIIVSAILIPKLTQEYIMHVAFVRLSDFIDIALFGFDITTPVQWILYLLLPVTVMLWRLGKLKLLPRKLHIRRR